MPAINLSLATPAANVLATSNSLKASKGTSTNTINKATFDQHLKSQTKSSGADTQRAEAENANSSPKDETNHQTANNFGLVHKTVKELLVKLEANGSNTNQPTANQPETDQQTLIGQLETLLSQLNQPTASNFLETDQGKQILDQLKETLQKVTSDNNGPTDPLMESLLALLQQFNPQNSSVKVNTDATLTQGSDVQQTLTGNGPKKTDNLGMGLDRLANQNQTKANSTQQIAASSAQVKLANQLNQNTQAQAGESVSVSEPLVDKLKTADGKNSQSGTDSNNSQSPSTLLYGGTGMGKVQQFLFHSQTNTAPASQPSEQILNQIQRMVSQGALKNSDGQLSVQLQLHPENLGTIQIGLIQTEQGLMASITAHSTVTKELIDGQLSHLEQALSASGIAVNKLEVNVTDQSQQGAQDSPYQQANGQQQDNRGYSQPSSQESTGDEESSDVDPFQIWLNEVNNL